MRKDYKILNNIKGLNFTDKILLRVFKRYTYKIYSAGAKDTFFYLDKN